jgi:tetratricopeptide (TPR) repeat protein
MWRILVILGWTLIASAASAAPGEAPLGEISFVNSGSAAAQAPFLRGLALLHNFEYERASAAFVEAETADPSFAMAYWGEAMTYNHPVWFEQNAAAARAALAKLGATAKVRRARAKSEREKAYLQALEILYGPGSQNARDLLYSDAMSAVHAGFPDDVDATAFYALSILGTAHEGRDFATYMRAAAVLETVFPEHRHHPGVLHYMIHSYDDPIHAPLGMRAARLYGLIAAGAPHAIHMTSHIFIALGLWDDVITANEAAMKAVNEQAAARGQSLQACGHYDEWLVYGYLQKRDLANADRVAGTCYGLALKELGQHPQPAFPNTEDAISYSDMVMRRVVETGRWPAALNLPLEDGAYVEARFNLAYAHALTQADQPAAFHTSADQLRRLLRQMQAHPAEPGSESQQAQALAFSQLMVEEIDALALIADGRTSNGIEALKQVADREIAIPLDFGPPDVPKPTLELLGDVLLRNGQPEAALVAYQKALTRTPGRTLAVEGVRQATAALSHITDKPGPNQELPPSHHH